AKFTQAFSGHSITVARGIGSSGSDPQAGYRQNVCQFVDERLSPAQKLKFIHQVLGRDMVEVGMFFDRIEAFVGSVNAEAPETPAFKESLARVAGDREARERYLAFARKSASAPMRARMIDVAHELGWLSKAERQAEMVRMIDERMASNAMTFADVDL